MARFPSVYVGKDGGEGKAASGRLSTEDEVRER